ncbi:MAG: D-alanine--D-alanine ligase [Pseudomonadota bacterium]|nr:D-alanine--D-alanine ligase [Pseudomonadota bacterium]
MRGNVTVLMGGISSEREISLLSGNAVAEALKSSGYQVTKIDIQEDLESVVSRLEPETGVVFNALHGRYGEDGCIQGLLNLMEVPYTHSGVLASALAMNKPMAKRIFKSFGIKVPTHEILGGTSEIKDLSISPPFVIKPISEGSSVGVNIVMTENYSAVSEGIIHRTNLLMVEEYIDGRELTVAVMGEKALGVTEIDTTRQFYDYEAKYTEGGSNHQIPADLPSKTYNEAMRIAILAHQVLGCRGVSRSDIRFDGKDLFLLEVNTQPGMTPTSLVPEQAAFANISFKELVTWMVEHAECDS